VAALLDSCNASFGRRIDQRENRAAGRPVDCRMWAMAGSDRRPIIDEVVGAVVRPS